MAITPDTTGGLFEITRQAVQAMLATHWGEKIPVPTEFDPQTGRPTKFEYHDTGVNQAIQELMNRLASQDPISLQKTLTLIAPANAPAISIIGDGGNGDPVDLSGFTGSILVLTGVVIDLGTLTVDTSGLSVNTSGLSVTAGTLGVSFTVSGCDVSGSITGAPALSGSASITGTATISGTPTVTPTYVTLTFANGLLKSVG